MSAKAEAMAARLHCKGARVDVNLVMQFGISNDGEDLAAICDKGFSSMSEDDQIVEDGLRFKAFLESESKSD